MAAPFSRVKAFAVGARKKKKGGGGERKLIKIKFRTSAASPEDLQVKYEAAIDHRGNLGGPRGLYPRLFDADNKTMNTSVPRVHINNSLFFFYVINGKLRSAERGVVFHAP